MFKTSLLAAAAVLTAGSASAQEWNGFTWAATSRAPRVSCCRCRDWRAVAPSDCVAYWFPAELDVHVAYLEGTGFGIQAGYNWQVTDHIVLGAEVGYSQLQADDDRVLPQTATSYGPLPTYAPVNRIERTDSSMCGGQLDMISVRSGLRDRRILKRRRDPRRRRCLAATATARREEASDWVGGFSYGVGARRFDWAALGPHGWNTHTPSTMTDEHDGVLHRQHIR